MLCSIMSLTVISWGPDVPQLIINQSILLLFFKADSVFLSHLLQTITEQGK